MSPVITIVRCPRCCQPVYAAEQVLAGGKKWHSLCFNCGLCNKPLSSTSVSVHEGDVFCKQCYSRLFGIRGVGFGMGAGTLSMDSGESFKLHQDLVEQTRRTMSTTAPTPQHSSVPDQRGRTVSGMPGSYSRPARMTATASLYSQPINSPQTSQQIDNSYDLPNTSPLYQRFNNPNLNEYSSPIRVPSYSPEPNPQIPIDPQTVRREQPQPYASSPVYPTQNPSQSRSVVVPVDTQSSNAQDPKNPHHYPQSSF